MSDVPFPTTVDGVTDIIAIAAGRDHTCAVKREGKVMCWGANNAGQLGHSSTSSSALPLEVPGLAGVTAVSAGDDHTCAIVTGGEVKCWGWNSHGQIGNDGVTNLIYTPVTVVGLSSGAISIAAGSEFSCVTTDTGAVWCWGRNYAGQLGNKTKTDSNVPVRVFGF